MNMLPMEKYNLEGVAPRSPIDGFATLASADFASLGDGVEGFGRLAMKEAAVAGDDGGAEDAAGFLRLAIAV